MGLLSGAKKLGGKVRKGFEQMHLDSVSAQLDVGTLVHDPGQYFSNMKDAYGRDIAFGGEVWGRFKQGDFKGIAAQGASDTVLAFGGSREQAAKAAGAAGKAGAAYGKANQYYQAGAAVKEGLDSGDYGAALKGAEGFGGDIGSTAATAGRYYAAGSGAMAAYETGDYGGALESMELAGGSIGKAAGQAAGAYRTGESLYSQGSSMLDALESSGASGIDVASALGGAVDPRTITAANVRDVTGTIDAKAVTGKLGDGGDLAVTVKVSGSPRGGIIEGLLSLFGL